MSNYVEDEATIQMELIDNASVEFYENYPAIEIESNLNRYINGEMSAVSVSSDNKTKPYVWKVITDRLLAEDELLGVHADIGHPADSRLAVKLINEELNSGNISVSLNPNPRLGKEREASRVKLTFNQPIEREARRYLHLQMAIEIADKVDKGEVNNGTLFKCLSRFARENPGLATIICSQLIGLQAETNNLKIKLDDIYDIVPDLTKNRYTDKQLIHDLYDLLGNAPYSKEKTDLAIQRVSERFPNESNNLRITSNFKELVKPIIIFESALNIMTERILPRRQIDATNLVFNKLFKVMDSFTSEVVTAYVEHIPVHNFKQLNEMLSNKTLFQFTSSNKPLQIP